MASNFVPVFYATTEGQTRRIAEEIASTIRRRGFTSDAIEISASMPPIDWERIAGAVVGGSIHIGKHQKALTSFVARELARLNATPTAFFSVSLSAGSSHAAEVDAARKLADDFVKRAGWKPRRVVCFAGKLAYSQYGLITRQLMRLIAWREGGPTDTHRDYDLTDWAEVRRLALAFATDLEGTPAVGAIRHAM
jgi:menaquinone-dependent protoporphyrinogen oxidase